MLIIDILGVSHAYDRVSPEIVGLNTVSFNVAPNTPTLVFVHGWMLSRQYWQPMMAHLSDRYDCIAYDLRGFGDSAAGASPYSLQAYAHDLITFLAQLNLTQVWLVGHSLGGSIALWAAHLDPDRVQGVIGVNAGGGIYIRDQFEKFRAVGQQIVKFRPTWLRYAPLLDLVFARNAVTQRLDRAWGRQRIVDFVRADRAAALGSLLESTTESEVHRLPGLVAGLTQPAYFIAGMQDSIMPQRFVYHLASYHASFSQGENVTDIAHCGHLAMLEHPQTVAQIIGSIVTPKTSPSYPTSV